MAYDTVGVQKRYFSSRQNAFFYDHVDVGHMYRNQRCYKCCWLILRHNTSHVLVCAFVDLFSWGTCFHALQVAHGSCPHFSFIFERHRSSPPSCAFEAILVLWGQGWHASRVFRLARVTSSQLFLLFSSQLSLLTPRRPRRCGPLTSRNRPSTLENASDQLREIERQYGSEAVRRFKK